MLSEGFERLTWAINELKENAYLELTFMMFLIMMRTLYFIQRA